MNDFDPKWLKKFEELENLDEIEARLVRQERNTRMALIVMMILAMSAFALLLGHLAPSMVVPPALRFHLGKGLTRNSRPSPSSNWTGSTNPPHNGYVIFPVQNQAAFRHCPSILGDGAVAQWGSA